MIVHAACGQCGLAFAVDLPPLTYAGVATARCPSCQWSTKFTVAGEGVSRRGPDRPSREDVDETFRALKNERWRLLGSGT